MSTSSPCVVCLAPDGVGLARACQCNTRIHAQCLAGMLEHGYEHCRVCLQPFTTDAVMAARRSMLARPAMFTAIMDFCHAATCAGRGADSLAALTIVPADLLGDIDLAQYLFERGRSMELRKRHTAAENDFEHALRLLRRHPECSVRPRAWTLTSLASVRIEQARLNEAAACLYEAFLLVHKLPPKVVEGMMRVVAKYCLARNDMSHHARAHKAIHDLVRAGCPCPVGRAKAYLEMRLAETAASEETIDAEGSLQASLKALRRSDAHAELVAVASRLLGSRCPPSKRCRYKTHPEEAATAVHPRRAVV